jgi:hypothetical protein
MNKPYEAFYNSTDSRLLKEGIFVITSAFRRANGCKFGNDSKTKEYSDNCHFH